MINHLVLTALQIGVGVCLVVYALVLIGQRLRQVKWRMPRWVRKESDDLRVLIDMAARFRDAGNTAAVDACQALIDQLLHPKP